MVRKLVRILTWIRLSETFSKKEKMRLFKAILVGLIAVFSRESAWEMALKGVSRDSVKSEIKTKAASVSNEFPSKGHRQNNEELELVGRLSVIR